MTSENDCYCCGADAHITKKILGSMTVNLCPFCTDVDYIWTHDGYWSLTCSTHGQQDIVGMVQYWDAIDLFNEKWGTQKRGTKVKCGIDWQAELEKLRQEWREKEQSVV